MSWFGKQGLTILNPNNHFITCLLIFILHYSPQFSVKPLLLSNRNLNFNSDYNFNNQNNSNRNQLEHGVWKQE